MTQEKQLSFGGEEMQEAAKTSLLRQSLVELLSNAEKHEAQNNPYSIMRKEAQGSREDFVMGYLTTDFSPVRDEGYDEGDEDENTEQVVVFIHSRLSPKILAVTRNSKNINPSADFENQELRMFLLPWPPLTIEEEQTINLVRFLIDFTSAASAWDEFESNIPSVRDFIRDSFLRQEDLENIKFK